MSEGQRLDPQDWPDFRRAFHDLLDACLDRMQNAGAHPWHPPPADLPDRIALKGTGDGMQRTFDRILADILPHATGNTHPRFWGWVHGTGIPVSVAAELVAATMNSNLGGRDHGAMHVERAVLEWLRGIAGFPPGATGILTGGTSEATLIALCAARKRLFDDVRAKGIGARPDLRVYMAGGAHSCIPKALEVMGHGTEAIFRVASDKAGVMDPSALETALSLDRADGILPLAVVGTAGSVNTGVYDPLNDIADICARENVWFHVDSAFGFWTRLAAPPWRGLADGLERADSVATDFHKWIGVPYACGACVIADGDLHRATFASRPAYLEEQAQGLGGGSHWFCDYGLDLSRGFRALKVWAAVEALGVAALGQAVTDNCRQAAHMGALVAASNSLDLACPVVSNVCCIAIRQGNPAEVAARLQIAGEAVFSVTNVVGRPCLRAAIVNHRTTTADIESAVAAVERAVQSAG